MEVNRATEKLNEKERPGMTQDEQLDQLERCLQRFVSRPVQQRGRRLESPLLCPKPT